MSGLLRVEHLSVCFHSQPVLSDISFSLPVGDIIAIVGASGCGKSTLLNVIGGIITDYRGNVTFADVPVSKTVRGYMPQNLGLMDWKKVRDNIFISRDINKVIGVSDSEATDIIDELGIGDLLDRYPSELSGGQRQRVALARLFVSNPDILMMDEPFSALDTITADMSRELFLRLWQKRRTTTIFTTHNLHEAVLLGQHIMIMGKNPGRVLRVVDNRMFGREADYDEEFYTKTVCRLQVIMKNEYR